MRFQSTGLVGVSAQPVPGSYPASVRAWRGMLPLAIRVLTASAFFTCPGDPGKRDLKMVALGGIRMVLVVTLHVPSLLPFMDGRVLPAVMLMIGSRRASPRQFARFLRHRDLVDIGRIHDRNRGDRFRFGGGSGVALHT